MNDFIHYYDYNATTPLLPEVLEAMLPWMKEHFANASSAHGRGRRAARAVDQAREQVAELLNAHPEEIFFTSGATESINLALRGLSEAYLGAGDCIASQKTEHKAVLDTLESLSEKNFPLLLSPPEIWRSEAWKDYMKEHPPKLLTLMWINNETGEEYPVGDAAEYCELHKILFFTDATQAAGKIPLNTERIPVHALAFSAHKMYGPQGIGILYLRRTRGRRIFPAAQITGGGHQEGIRAGTLPVALIAGAGKACSIARSRMEEHRRKIMHLRNLFEEQIKKEIPGALIVAENLKRIYNTSMVIFPRPLEKIAGLWEKYAFSSGAACSSEKKEPSHVLKAMGYSPDQIQNAYRFSFGIYNTEIHLHELVRDLKNSMSSSPSF